MKPANLDEMLSRVQELPSLPDNCIRIQQLMDDPDATPLDVARTIESDPSLSATVLKLVNSAYCAVPGGVDSLRRAVCFLGFTTIHGIVLCMQSFKILGGRGGDLPAILNSHALSVASVAKELAVRVGISIPHTAFSAGLLHDLGRVALATLVPDQVTPYLEAVAKLGTTRSEIEEEIFGADHQTIGSALARHWKFPQGLVRVIGNHHGAGHNGAGQENPQELKLCDVVAVADSWSWHSGKPSVPGSKPPLVDPERIKRTGLSATPSEEDQSLIDEIAGAQFMEIM